MPPLVLFCAQLHSLPGFLHRCFPPAGSPAAGPSLSPIRALGAHCPLALPPDLTVTALGPARGCSLAAPLPRCVLPWAGRQGSGHSHPRNLPGSDCGQGTCRVRWAPARPRGACCGPSPLSVYPPPLLCRAPLQATPSAAMLFWVMTGEPAPVGQPLTWWTLQPPPSTPTDPRPPRLCHPSLTLSPVHSSSGCSLRPGTPPRPSPDPRYSPCVCEE